MKSHGNSSYMKANMKFLMMTQDESYKNYYQTQEVFLTESKQFIFQIILIQVKLVLFQKCQRKHLRGGF
jgi:hypothetical protein